MPGELKIKVDGFDYAVQWEGAAEPSQTDVQEIVNTIRDNPQHHRDAWERPRDAKTEALVADYIQRHLTWNRTFGDTLQEKLTGRKIQPPIPVQKLQGIRFQPLGRRYEAISDLSPIGQIAVMREAFRLNPTGAKATIGEDLNRAPKPNRLERMIAAGAEKLQTGTVGAGKAIALPLLMEMFGEAQNPDDAEEQHRTVALPFWERAKVLAGQPAWTMGQPYAEAMRQQGYRKASGFDQLMENIKLFGTDLPLDPTTYLTMGASAAATRMSGKAAATLTKAQAAAKGVPVQFAARRRGAQAATEAQALGALAARQGRQARALGAAATGADLGFTAAQTAPLAADPQQIFADPIGAAVALGVGGLGVADAAHRLRKPGKAGRQSDLLPEGIRLDGKASGPAPAAQRPGSRGAGPAPIPEAGPKSAPAVAVPPVKPPAGKKAQGKKAPLPALLPTEAERRAQEAARAARAAREAELERDAPQEITAENVGQHPTADLDEAVRRLREQEFALKSQGRPPAEIAPLARTRRVVEHELRRRVKAETEPATAPEPVFAPTHTFTNRGGETIPVRVAEEEANGKFVRALDAQGRKIRIAKGDLRAREKTDAPQGQPAVEPPAQPRPEPAPVAEAQKASEKPKRPDGRLLPQNGDAVTQTVPGPFGTPAVIQGEVYKAKNGSLRVRVTGSNAIIGGTDTGKTYPLNDAWNVRNDPELTRRQQKLDRDRKEREEALTAEAKTVFAELRAKTEAAKRREGQPPTQTTPPPTEAEPEVGTRGMARRGKKLLQAKGILDFEVGRDRVERRGNRTYVVDTKGEHAPVEVRHDALDTASSQRLQALEGKQRDKMIEAIQRTPYLSDEGKRERLEALSENRPMFEVISPGKSAQKSTSALPSTVPDGARKSNLPAPSDPAKFYYRSSEKGNPSVEVEAEAVAGPEGFEGYDLFVHRSSPAYQDFPNKAWAVSEGRTGQALGLGKDRDSAIEHAYANMRARGFEHVEADIQKSLERIGYSERYAGQKADDTLKAGDTVTWATAKRGGLPFQARGEIVRRGPRLMVKVAEEHVIGGKKYLELHEQNIQRIGEAPVSPSKPVEKAPAQPAPAKAEVNINVKSDAPTGKSPALDEVSAGGLTESKSGASLATLEVGERVAITRSWGLNETGAIKTRSGTIAEALVADDGVPMYRVALDNGKSTYLRLDKKNWRREGAEEGAEADEAGRAAADRPAGAEAAASDGRADAGHLPGRESAPDAADAPGEDAASLAGHAPGDADQRPGRSEGRAGASARHGDGDRGRADSGDLPGRAGVEDSPGREAGQESEGAKPEGAKAGAAGVLKEAKSAAVRNQPQERQKSGLDYAISPEDRVGQTTFTQKAHDLIAAIQTLKAVESAGRLATQEEQRTLVKFPGWGWTGNQLHPSKLGTEPHDSIVAALTKEELRAAERATLNSHYTDTDVIAAMYDGLARLGFTGGKVLEPSAGIGHFLGMMPPDLATKSRWSAVELDDLTFRALRQLYQRADARPGRFEKQRFAPNSFDLVVSNVPFGNFPVSDNAFVQRSGVPELTKLIHNYFIARSLELTRPGGIVAAITSEGTLNAHGPTGMAVRKYLAEQADLVGAIRLPAGAFSQSAGTEVTTDILFFRKKDPDHPLDAKHSQPFQKVAEIGEDNGKPLLVNEYFVKNPQMALGRHSNQSRMQGEGTRYALLSDGRDIRTELPELMRRALPAKVVSPTQAAESFAPPDPTKAGRTIRGGSLGIDATSALGTGKAERRAVVFDADGNRIRLEVTPKQVEVIAGFVRLRDSVSDLIAGMQAGIDDAALKRKQTHLRDWYQEFVRKYGELHKPHVRKLFENDPDSGAVLALEKWDREAKKAVGLSDIFTQRVIEPEATATRADSAEDALAISLRETGQVDLARMAELTQKTEAEVADALGGMIFAMPDGKWLTREEYGSGNVRAKLAQAMEMEAAEPEKYGAHVEYLRSVQPKDLTPGQITPVLGAHWIPESIYEGFMGHLFGGDKGDVHKTQRHQARRSAVSNRWTLKAGYYADPVARVSTWGTVDVDGIKLLEDAMNNKAPLVTEKVRSGNSERTVVNEEKTELARAKCEAIKEEFGRWAYAHPERSVEIANVYNATMNVWRVRKYDGSHLTLPGQNRLGLKGGTLYPHQKNAVWRILQNRTALLAHEVGTGKTYTMITAAMELRRTGLRKKPMLVVQNSTIGQFAESFQTLYPNAKILVADAGGNFSAQRRREFLGKIATGDWDAVIFTQSALKLVPVHPQTAIDFYEREKSLLRDALYDLPDRDRQDKKNPTVKEVQKAIELLDKRIQEFEAQVRARQDDSLYFDDLGVDQLFIDEAHAYKNLMRKSRFEGLSIPGNDVTFDMLMKSQLLAERGGGIVFATGTPITNSIGEVHSLLRYLAPDLLRDTGTELFDAWASSFGQMEVGLERSVSGSYQNKTRFLKFSNVPELSQQYRQVGDVVFAEDVPGLVRPRLTDAAGKFTDRPIIVTTHASPEQRAFYVEMKRRADAIRGRRRDEVTKGDDTFPNISTDGRMVTLDARLRMPAAPDHPYSKINRVVENVFAEWARPDNRADQRTQLIFMDMGRPKEGKKATEAVQNADMDVEAAASHVFTEEFDDSDFDLYNDIKRKLINRGVPADQIAFIYDAKDDSAREKLFARVKQGAVRVLIGSRQKMGVGVNVQDRLVAIHQVDPTWRPDQMEQADGRIIRQGNLFADRGVRIYQYLVENTFDEFMWRKIAGKAGFLRQFSKADPNLREMEDVSGKEEFTEDELAAIASGNPKMQEMLEVKEKSGRLMAARRGHVQAQADLWNKADATERRIPFLEAQVERMDALQREIEAEQEKAFVVHVDGGLLGKKLTDAKAAGEALIQMAAGMDSHAKRKGSFLGVPFELEKDHFNAGRDENGQPVWKATAKVTFVKEGFEGRSATINPDAPQAAVTRLTNAVEAMADAKWARATLSKLRADLPKLREEAQKPFAKEAELQGLEARLKELEKEIGVGAKEGKERSWADTLPGGEAHPEAVRQMRAHSIRYRHVFDDAEEAGPAARAGAEAEEFEGDLDDGDGAGEDGEESFGAVIGAGRSPTPGAAGKAATSGGRIPVAPLRSGRAKSPHRIILDVGKAVGRRVRAGRPERNMAGGYYPGSAKTVIRFAGDLDKAAHEIAHALDDAFGIVADWNKPRVRSPFDVELQEFWQHGSVRQSGPKARLTYKRAEGVAEWVRAWIVNPQAAEAAAPQFAQHFLRKIDAQTRGALTAFSDDVRQWAGASAHEQILSNVRMGREQLPLSARLKRAARGEGFAFETTRLDRWQAWMQDSLKPFTKAVAAAREVRGKAQLLPEHDPVLLARLHSGINSKVREVLERGLVDARNRRVTPGGVEWLLEPFDRSGRAALERDMQHVVTYMIAERTLEKGRQLGSERVSGIGAGLLAEPDVAMGRLKEALQDPAQAARIQEGAARYRQWADGLLRYALESGRLSQQRYRDIRASNEFYVSFKRVAEELDAELFAKASRNLGTRRSVVERLKGSTREIDNPYRALLDQTFAIIRESDRNRALRQFRDLLTTDRKMYEGDVQNLAEIGRKARSGEKNTIEIFVDGKAEHWQFEEGVYEALKGFGDTSLPGWLQAIGTLPQIARGAITHSPGFLLRNTFRDAIERSLYSDAGSKPWASLRKFSDADKDALRLAGGDQAGHYLESRPGYHRSLEAAIQELRQDKNTVIALPGKLVRGYDDLAKRSEMQGRLAEFTKAFEAAQARGMDTYNAQLYAAGQARGLMDFAVAGTIGRQINQLIPFANATLQGNVKLLSQFRSRSGAKRFMQRWLVTVVAAEVAVAAWNAARGDEEEYWQLPAYQRDLFWNFKAGPDTWVRVPKGFEQAVFASGVSRAMAQARGDRNAFEGWGGSLARSFLPLDEADLAGPFGAYFEAAANHDFFRGRGIVPAHEDRLALQKREGTARASRLGQAMQAMFGLDARKADFLLRSQFGEFGSLAGSASDLGRQDKAGTGMGDMLLGMTGLLKPSPATAARDVQAVQRRAAQIGETKNPLKAQLDAYFRARSAQERDAAAERLRGRGSALRPVYERLEAPPRKIGARMRGPRLKRPRLGGLN